MTERGRPKVIGMRHVGMYAEDPSALAEFYQDVMGMELVGGSEKDSPAGWSAFLSSRPDEEDHEIAMFDNRDLAHTAFKVSSLADLRAFYQDIVDRGLPIKLQFNHGVSLAFYFDDPEGNIIEVYWPTGLAYGQPYAHAIDLAMTEEALRQDVKELATRVGVAWQASRD